MILKMMICILLFLRNLGKEFLLNSFMQMKSQFMLCSQVDFKCFEILSSHKVHTTTQQNRRKKTKRGRKKEQVLLHTMVLIIIIIEPANVDDFYEGACTHIINAFSCSLLFMLKFYATVWMWFVLHWHSRNMRTAQTFLCLFVFAPFVP